MSNAIAGHQNIHVSPKARPKNTLGTGWTNRVIGNYRAIAR
ncbi:MAG: hypothetical protein ACFE0J_13110 [Elainellaceae cyanobacterium]